MMIGKIWLHVYIRVYVVIKRISKLDKSIIGRSFPSLGIDYEQFIYFEIRIGRGEPRDRV